MPWQRGMLLLAAVVGTIVIVGDDPGVESRIRDSLARVPDCLRGSLATADVEVTRRPLDAHYDYVGHRLGVSERLVIDAQRLADTRSVVASVCATVEDLESLVGDLDRVLLHEVAHAYHFDLEGGGLRNDIERFLEIRWKDAYEAHVNDPDNVRLWKRYREAQGRVASESRGGREPSTTSQQALCDLQEEVAEVYGKLPSRFPGDFHALDDPWGSEYFAMAIETLVHAPEIFCRSYSVEEMVILREILGQCIAQMRRRPSCYDEIRYPVPPVPGAGMRRD